jgi:mono/diheme cytochrome c family protein
MEMTRLGTTALLWLGLIGSTAMAQQISAASGVYTEADAQRGQASYASKCATCHGRNMTSNGDAPSLVGEPFAFGWKGKTLGERFTTIKETMPPTDPGTLDDQLILDVIAYILKVNGYPAGSTALQPDPARLQQIVIPR